MTREERHSRFEELDAGRAMGDLDAAEAAEWETLARELGRKADAGYDRLAGELEATSAHTPLPPELAARLKASSRPEKSPQKSPVIAIGPWIGWAVAACLLGLLLIRGGKPDPLPSPAERREAFLSKGEQVIRLPFAGAGGDYTSAGGEVVWSDNRQEGYMTLSQLPANDPAVKQYQLWIVDPTRDEFPVDGGVFDVPTAGGPVVIPIQAKLPVHAPAAFVITLEKPGGVVRSKQEIVVAIAKS